MYVLTPQEMRNIDNRGIEDFGISGIILMENAAISAFDIIESEYSKVLENGLVSVFVGGGNNGGDGLAIARHLMLRGRTVEVFLFSPKDRIRGDAKVNLNIYEKLGGEIIPIIEDSHLADLKSQLKGSSLVVDSLLGTGIDRDIKGPMKKAIEMVNGMDIPVVAVDIPSGINGETGRVMGTAIKADHTVTFAYAKRGHIFYPGRSHSGRLHVVPISLPTDSGTAMGINTFTLDDREVSLGLKERPEDGHKGVFGKIGVIAGSLGMAGAASLTSMAALKGGGGLVTLACPRSIVPIVQTKMTEVMAYGLEDGGEGYLTKDAISAIHDFVMDKDVLAIGPGLGLECEGFEILRYILREFDISIIMDADALNHISKERELLKSYRGSMIVTPHPGEMARLTGKPIGDILAQPVETAKDFARDMGVVVILKGATSVVAEPGGSIYLNSSGNSGMGTAGSGDVLAGLVTSLVAQGYDPYDAAVYGCYIHGRAGDYAKARHGDVGMVAGDILDELPKVIKDLYSLRKDYIRIM